MCIIGAGLAGLSAAYDIGRHNTPVIVLDAAQDFGGLASSTVLGGVAIERFYHFICRGDDDLLDLAQELGIGHQVHWQESKTAFFYNGSLYSFGTPLDVLCFRPVPLLQRIRFGLNVVHSRYRKQWLRLDGISAKRWLIDRVGQQAYDVIWDPLLRVKFGDYHEQVSAAWIWHRLHRVASSRRKPWEPEQLGYLEGGTDTLVRTLHAKLQTMPNVQIRSNIRVEEILTQAGRVVGVGLAGGERLEASAVVSTIALAGLVKLVRDFDDEYRHRLSRIDYIGVVCGVLKLSRPITNSFWVNINDPRITYNGVIEYTNLNRHAREAFGGKSIAYIPYYIRTNSARYKFSDDVLYQEFVDGLRWLNPQFEPGWIEECKISREPHAQAICTVGFASMVPGHRSPVAGLYLTDSSQYYPEDRTISAAIRLGRRVAKMLRDDTLDFTTEVRFPNP